MAPSRLAAFACVAAALAGSPPAAGADAANGRMLYETGCTGCHAQSVHGRTDRTATSCAAIREQVTRWAAHQGRNWSGQDVDDVVLWLNQRYYRLPDRDGSCAAPTARMRATPRLARY